ncbi:MAG: uracil-DNA glycosylase [Clostridia bacterium]|nr:uracil-DNA glycosylase [Clostridia bacterium]
MKIAKSWYERLKPEFEKPYYKELQEFLKDEYAHYTIYPEADNVFNALNLVPFDKVRVVIIGQDPYHGPKQAHGLCFSVQKGVDVPPSLQNIYKEIQNDLGYPIPKTGELTHWAKQGVLLLNSVLTVRAGQANSHKGKGWEEFTGAIIKMLSDRPEPVIFILWGNNAKAVASAVDTSKHFILTAPHPSPLSAYAGFFGCKHFSKCNEFLKSLGTEPIDWHIPE